MASLTHIQIIISKLFQALMINYYFLLLYFNSDALKSLYHPSIFNSFNLYQVYQYLIIRSYLITI